MPDQIKEEIRGALDFLSTVYSTFGFTYTLKLSTRPEKFLGEIETWDKAEKMMEESLNESGLAWKLNPAGKHESVLFSPRPQKIFSRATADSYGSSKVESNYFFRYLFKKFR